MRNNSPNRAATRTNIKRVREAEGGEGGEGGPDAGLDRGGNRLG